MSEIPAEVLAHLLLEESAWVEFRDSGIVPLVETELVTTAASRLEFLVGAWLLDRTVKDGGLLANVKPQMLRVVDVLAAGRLLNGVIEPRRSSKTTTLFCILLGRCYVRPVHMAGFTLATTQKKAAERYRLDVYGPIVRQWPDESARPVKLYKGNGTERVEFDNGSVLAVLSPDGEAFRSGAYDTLLVDEGGEASTDMGDDIQSAVLPAFDTRPDGQFIVAGTAAKFRDGNILWDTLNDSVAGVLRFTVPDTVDPEELEAWEPDEEHPRARVRELIEGMHPGVGTLTTLERIALNYRKLGIERFGHEYLGLFGMEGANQSLIPAPQYEAALLQEAMPSMPKLFTLAVAVHPDRAWASVGVAWKRDDGHVLVGLLHHQDGVKGFAQKVLSLARKLKVPVIYDDGSTATAVEIEFLARATPRPQLSKMVTGDVRRSATKVLKRFEEGTIHHYGQTQLDDAARVAVKRPIGNAGGFGFGRPKDAPGVDITPLEAIALAVHVLDDEQPKQKIAIVFAV